MAFGERDHAVETLVLNRAHEALRVGVRIGPLIRRLHYADSHLAQLRAHRHAPLRVAVTDQHAITDQDPLVCGREHAGNLAHEHLIRMRWQRDAICCDEPAG